MRIFNREMRKSSSTEGVFFYCSTIKITKPEFEPRS